jgi:alkylation response protein AidB-like acyl-CoA dehydrogenase
LAAEVYGYRSEEIAVTSPCLTAVDEIVADVIVPDAQAVDRDGVFPRKAIDALGAAGVLGLTVPVAVGGAGGALREAAAVVERLSQACGSTAMVVLMHYAGTALLNTTGHTGTQEAIAAGRHLTTLAFSESGSRSHFWAPMSTAHATGAEVGLSADKSWVTSAGEANSYVWSSRPLAADGPMTLWLVPADAPGIDVAGPFDGLGLRGNASRPVRGRDVPVPLAAMLGADGAGLDLAMETALPWFLVLSAAFSLGLMRATLTETIGHLTRTRLEHLGLTLAEQPLVRQDIGHLRIEVDRTAALVDSTISALESGHPDAMLRLLGVKAAAAESAIAVTDIAMKACGGAAFRKELGIERRFRDARAARVMAPTTDRLTDFVGRVACGMPLLDAQ